MLGTNAENIREYALRDVLLAPGKIAEINIKPKRIPEQTTFLEERPDKAAPRRKIHDRSKDLIALPLAFFVKFALLFRTADFILFH